MDRRQYITVVGSVLLAGCSNRDNDRAATPANTPNSTPTTNQTETQQQTPTNQSVQIGEIFGNNDLKAVVQDVTREQKLGQFQEAGADNDFVVVRLAVKNVSSQYDYDIGGINPLFDAVIRDDESYTYDIAVETTETPFVAGVVSPGEVMRGDEVYKIPDGSSGLEMEFDFSNTSIFSSNQVTVDLSAEAAQKENLNQDLGVTVYSVGDTVAFDGLEITINGVEYTRENNSQKAIVDVTFANNTGGEISQLHLKELWCKDGRGRYMGKDFFSSLSQRYSTNSALSPGETRRGKVPFDIIPANPEELYCTYEFSEHVEGQKAFWELK